MNKYGFREIAVDCDGELLVCVDGKISGPADLVKRAKENSITGELVQLRYPFGEMFEANLKDGDPFGEVAALMSVRPGRSVILQAPEEVLTYLNDDSVDGNDEEYVIVEDENTELLPDLDAHEIVEPLAPDLSGRTD